MCSSLCPSFQFSKLLPRALKSLDTTGDFFSCLGEAQGLKSLLDEEVSSTDLHREHWIIVRSETAVCTCLTLYSVAAFIWNAESANTRNGSMCARPFPSFWGWGLGTRLSMLRLPHLLSAGSLLFTFACYYLLKTFLVEWSCRKFLNDRVRIVQQRDADERTASVDGPSKVCKGRLASVTKGDLAEISQL